MIQQSPAKTKNFLKAINKAAMQKCNEIADQIEETTKLELQRAEDEARRDGHLKIDAAKAKIEADAQMQIARYETQKKKEIYEKRNHYRQEVFEQAKNQLCAFVKSDAYAPFIAQCLQTLEGNVSQNLTFYIAANDMIAQKAIAAAYEQATIQADAALEIGGYKVSDNDKHILLDDSLDARLNEQLEWFLLNSHLKVEV